MSDSDIASRKRELRAQVTLSRQQRTPEERTHTIAGLRERINEVVLATHATRIAAYLPTETEPPIGAALDELEGVQILWPISRPDRSMDWAPHPAGTSTHVDALGMPAPRGEIVSRDELDRLELVLCPAALVDRQGYRLGWGLGYYDRFLAGLAHKPPVFAVVFDDEVVDALPHESHDHPVSGIITPTRVIWL